MFSSRDFEEPSGVVGLIVYWPAPTDGLWDSEVSTLVDHLENELDIFVTHAGPEGAAPRLRDAVAAARFMGCRRAVVVTRGAAAVPPAERDEAGALGIELTVVPAAALRASDVARSFRSASRPRVEAA
jgi:hypothetical protein